MGPISKICRPGVLEAADLAGWELLARVLRYLSDELWALYLDI